MFIWAARGAKKYARNFREFLGGRGCINLPSPSSNFLALLHMLNGRHHDINVTINAIVLAIPLNAVRRRFWRHRALGKRGGRGGWMDGPRKETGLRIRLLVGFHSSTSITAGGLKRTLWTQLVSQCFCGCYTAVNIVQYRREGWWGLFVQPWQMYAKQPTQMFLYLIP